MADEVINKLKPSQEAKSSEVRRVCMICNEESDSAKWALEHNCTRDAFVRLQEENQRLRSALEEITESDDDGNPAWSQRDMVSIASAALEGDGK